MALKSWSRRPSSARLAVLMFALYQGPAALLATPTRQDNAGAGPDSSAIVGRLVARDSHEPIPRARVALSDTPLTTTTDSSGRFTFTGLPPGAHTLEIRAVGYAPATWPVTLAPGQVLAHDFELTLLAYQLPEVVVKDKGLRRFADFERRRQSGMGAFITRERIDRANTASLVDVLVTVRGVKQVCISNECVAKMVRSPPG